MSEKQVFKMNGFVAFILSLVLLAVGLTLVVKQVTGVGAVLIVIGVIVLSSLTVVQPNEAKVCTFFGTYVGVIKEQGFWVTTPFTFKRSVSLRVVNFTSEKLKVNDLEGNPIEIAAVIVYKVKDATKAIYDVQDYEEFVKIQSETGIRHIASRYPYDLYEQEENTHSLRKNSDEVADEMLKDLQNRMSVAGVDVVEARIMHLAYSSEIAAAMLQRQQAQAVLSARKVIVEGAVGMVKSAIDQLSEQGVVDLDEEKKAQMVNNLMVALVSDKGSQPIVNAGSIY